VDGITLWFMGGVTRIEGDAQKPGTELAVAVVGPLASAALGGLGLLAGSWASGAGWSLAGSALYWLGAINLFLAAFNLLPASPLDGGRVFHGLVWLVTGNRWWATRASAGAGVLLGSMCLAGGWYLFEAGDALDGAVLMVMGWFIVSSSKKESLLGRAQHVLGEVSVSDIMRPLYIAPAWLTVDAFWSDWVAPYPEAAFLLERWGGDGWAGVVTAEQLASVPPNMRRSVRARDVALSLPATAPGADTSSSALKPGDPALCIAGRQGVALLVEDNGNPVGVVVAPDIAAMVARGTPAQPRTWATFWTAPAARPRHRLS
jgi:Zn-dependent protease